MRGGSKRQRKQGRRDAEAQRPPTEAPPPATWDRRWGALLIALVVVVAFGRSLANEFTYDEDLVIYRADGFLKSGSLRTLVSKEYFGASKEGTYRPVVTLTYMLDRAVSESPLVFKAQSLLWHIACALLIMLLARRLLPPEHRRFALLAGLVFALHPITTEAVDNASFREDQLATFFVLAALLLALSNRLAAAAGCHALALLSKESAVVMPALLLGARLLQLGEASRPSRRRVALEVGVLSVLTVVYLAIRFGPMNTPGGYASTFPGGSRGAALLGMPAVFAHYLRLLVIPWPLRADYTGFFNFGPQPFIARVVPFAVLFGFVAAVLVAARRGRITVAYGLGWFLVALVPVSNLVAIPIPAAERFLYMPLVGIALAVSAGVALVVARWPGAARPLLAAGAVVALAFLTVINLRHGDWRDEPSVWQATARTNPRSCGAHSALGGMKMREGIETHSPALIRESVLKQELALRLCPPENEPSRGAITLTRLGGAHALLGEILPARKALDAALRLVPRYPLAVVWLGYVHFLAGDKQTAETLLNRAVLELGPPDANVAEVAAMYVDKL